MTRLCWTVIALCVAGGAAQAGEPPEGSPAWAEAADVTEHLGQRLPLELGFTDSHDRPTRLGDLFDGTHPVLLVLAYYECPQLCSLVLDGAVAAMAKLESWGFKLGAQYRVATISFDATERTDQAARKQASVVRKLDHGDDAWPFLVGNAASVRALTDRLGFKFLRDSRTGNIAHTAVVFVISPDGTIARYLYGTDYPPRDLKLALLEASDGKTGSFGDKIMMRCFQYDANSRRYGLFISRFMKIGGLLIFLVVLLVLAVLLRQDRRRARAEEAS